MSLLQINVADGIATLTLNDDKRRNILSGDMVDAITAAVSALENDTDVHAIIVTGNGKAFCAGADLQDLSEARDGNGDAIQKVYQGFMTIAQCKLPTIAAVNGAAVGAGLNLALACDVRIAAESAKFDSRFLHLGLHPGGGCTWMLQRAVGWQQSTNALLFGQKFTGQQAVAAGLAICCVADEDCLNTAQELAQRAAGMPRELLIKTKQTLLATSHIDSHQQAVDIEYDVQMWSLQQPAFSKLIESMQQQIKGQ